MFLLFFVAATTAGCANDTPEAASRAVLDALATRNYSCLRNIIANPDLKFDGPELNPAVIDSLNFHASGNLSYFDMIKAGVKIDITGTIDQKSAFYILDKDWKLYELNKQNFKKKFYLKKYFVCNFIKSDNKWKLTEDLCFTEGD